MVAHESYDKPHDRLCMAEWEMRFEAARRQIDFLAALEDFERAEAALSTVPRTQTTVDEYNAAWDRLVMARDTVEMYQRWHTLP